MLVASPDEISSVNGSVQNTMLVLWMCDLQ